MVVMVVPGSFTAKWLKGRLNNRHKCHITEAKNECFTFVLFIDAITC
jgi:hypothetical protein